MTGRAVAVVLAVTVLTGACEFSDVDPDAEVTITGEVVDPDGQPAEGREVVVLVEPTGTDLLFGLPLGLGSLGLVCVADDPPPPCDTRRRTQTGADGRYTFTMTGRETQGALGDVAPLLLFAPGAARGDQAAGPVTIGELRVRDERVDVEPLHLWEAGIELRQDAGSAVVGWEPDPRVGDDVAGSATEVQFLDGPVTTWSATGSGGTATIDLRVLEDATGTVGVVVRGARAGGALDAVTYRSEQYAYASGAGAPVSRGATCAVVTDGGAVGTPTSPCPVTDGDLATLGALAVPCADPAAGCPVAQGYQLDLGAVREVELVVVRGCRSACAVAASPDGASFTPLVEATGPFAAFAPDPPRPLRYLRVTDADGSPTFTEISAWDGPAATPRFDAVTAPSSAQPGARAGGGDDGRSARWPVWLAGALVLVTAVGLGVAIGQRAR